MPTFEHRAFSQTSCSPVTLFYASFLYFPFRLNSRDKEERISELVQRGREGSRQSNGGLERAVCKDEVQYYSVTCRNQPQIRCRLAPYIIRYVLVYTGHHFRDQVENRQAKSRPDRSVGGQLRNNSYRTPGNKCRGPGRYVSGNLHFFFNRTVPSPDISACFSTGPQRPRVFVKPFQPDAIGHFTQSTPGTYLAGQFFRRTDDHRFIFTFYRNTRTSIRTSL